jgi:hypothetical protein
MLAAKRQSDFHHSILSILSIIQIRRHLRGLASLPAITGKAFIGRPLVCPIWQRPGKIQDRITSYPRAWWLGAKLGPVTTGTGQVLIVPVVGLQIGPKIMRCIRGRFGAPENMTYHSVEADHGPLGFGTKTAGKATQVITTYS